MATLGYAARVGVVVLFAIGLFAGMWYAFKKDSLESRTYTLDVLFDDASGAAKGIDVQLAGVKIGAVDSVTLVNKAAQQRLKQQADLKLKINKDIRIPTGSQFTIVTPVLGTTGVVSVVPPPDAAQRPNDIIPENTIALHGTQMADLNASLSRADILLEQLTVTTKKADQLIDAATGLVGNHQIQHGLQQTVGNLNAASLNGLKLTSLLSSVLAQDNAQVQALLRQTRSGSQAALGNITATTADLRQATHENRDKINSIIANLNDTTAAISGITGQTNDLLKNGDVAKNLATTVANLKVSTDNLVAISNSLAKLSTDKSVQSDLRDTVHNVKESTAEADYLLQRLNKIAGNRPRTAAVLVGPGGAVVIPSTQTPGAKPASKASAADRAPFMLPRADFLLNTRRHHFRSDIDAVAPFPGSPVSFVRAGIYGFGDSNRVNLQAGSLLSPGSLFDYRYGLYASKLSVGADAGLGRKASLSLDVYDPNRYRIDARGVFMLNQELGLVLGAEDITRRGEPLIGFEFRR